MKNNREDGKTNVRMELKYCEHCGGLWVREGGAGVYCHNCQPKVADLPVPKKPSGRIVLPVHPPTAVEEYGIEIGDDEDLDFEAAAGGVA